MTQRMPQLFQQKLVIPTAAHALIERIPLLDRFDHTITSKRLVVLAAPAGWGKTTVLAQWATRSNLPVAWYTLGRSDRDPHVFLDYLLHALIPIIPSVAAISEQLAVTSPKNLSDVYHTAALEIASAAPRFALVLDDFHTVDDEQLPSPPGSELIFELLGAIMEYAATCHLVIASRILPDRQGLARMVVQQRATVFDYGTLQFTPADVQNLAQISTNSKLDVGKVEQLAARFGGWAAGIVLSLNQSGQPDAPWLSDQMASSNQIYDFFAEQIIAPLDPDLQCFLEDISVLEDLSPQRCNLLRQRNDSAKLLNEVKRRGLFTARRGDMLVYHSLFRDFLRARLAQDPIREQTLVRSAGDLYRDEDDIERAIDCYLDTHALEEVIVLLRAMVPRFLQGSRQTLLLTCFDRLGAYLAQNHKQNALPPDILLLQARVYRDLALWERAELSLQLAEVLGDAETRWEATILHAELLNLQGNYQRAQAVLDTIAVSAVPPRLQFAYYRTIGRIQILAGAIDNAIISLEHAHAIMLTIVEASHDSSALATIYDLLGWAYAVQGERPTALRYLQRADACWQAVGNDGRRTTTLNNLGTLALEERRYAEARAAFQTGIGLAHQTTRRREEIDLLCSMGDLAIVEGNPEQATTHFREAYTLAVRMDLPSSLEAAVGALWSSAIQGDSAEAALWQQIVEAKGELRQPELQGRFALAKSLLLLRQTRTDVLALSELADKATAHEDSMMSTEQVVLTLLRASLLFEQQGWAGATAEWDVFMRSSVGLPERLLIHFVALHRRLFDAAAQHAPLAQRLIAIRQSKAPRHWHITALGTYSCLIDGIACDLSPLHRALLICLLDAGSKGLAVEQLWESIWGDTDISMPALHQALYRLRTQTGLAAAAREGICAIHSPWESIDYDVAVLEKTLNMPISYQSIQRAVELYQGDFLLSAPLSAAHWADARRAHLRQRYMDALEEYAFTVEDDLPDQAVQYYQRVLQLDGCREQTAARLMRLAAGIGNYSLVTETFDRLESALRLLGAAPEPATKALLRANASGAAPKRAYLTR